MRLKGNARLSDNRFKRIDASVAFDVVVPSLSDIVSGFARFKDGKAWESQICVDISI